VAVMFLPPQQMSRFLRLDTSRFRIGRLSDYYLQTSTN